jgi:5,6-dimethylbenzimidazole synthase
MDLFTAIKERRSCRGFLADPVSDETIEKILEAGIWAPSPANNQPWEFIVITSRDVKEKIREEAEKCKKMIFEKSGWKWVDRYRLGFVSEAPVIVAVVADPKKTGADMFLEGGGLAYQHGCAAAIQNMLLAAHALSLGTLWFTLFDPNVMRKILTIEPGKELQAMICIGKPSAEPVRTPRTGVKEKTRFIR